MPVKRWAQSKLELSALLGISRRTLCNWGRLPGCPGTGEGGRYEVGEWLRFGREVSRKDLAPQSMGEKHAWEVKLLAQKWHRTQEQFEREQSEWTHNSTIEEDLRALVDETLAVLRDELEEKAPVSDRPRNRLAIDRLMSRLNHGARTIVEKFPIPAVDTPAPPK